jgi:hypothetical protein
LNKDQIIKLSEKHNIKFSDEFLDMIETENRIDKIKEAMIKQTIADNYEALKRLSEE